MARSVFGSLRGDVQVSFPEPLTPPDCDLSDFAFMPLEVARLRRSRQWLAARRRPEIGFYAINLWSAAWHERPAASLELDDDVLADAAMCDPQRWPDVRDDVLRGWVRCGDGRIYHPVVAAKALEAWIEKLVQRKSSEAGNAKRYGREFDPSAHDMSISAVVSLLARMEPGSRTVRKFRFLLAPGVQPASRPAPGGSPAGSQGTGKGQGQDSESSLRSDSRGASDADTFARELAAASEAAGAGLQPARPRRRRAASATPSTSVFDDAWALWPQRTRSSKKIAAAAWANAAGDDATKLAALKRYLASEEARKNGGAFVPALERWITKRLASWVEAGMPRQPRDLPAGAFLATAVGQAILERATRMGGHAIALAHAWLPDCEAVGVDALRPPNGFVHGALTAERDSDGRMLAAMVKGLRVEPPPASTSR